MVPTKVKPVSTALLVAVIVPVHGALDLAV
jgi:hypothetical protein